MNAQNPSPNNARKNHRIAFPRSPDAARARAVRNFGTSKWSVEGSGSAASISPLRSPISRLSVEDIHQRSRGVLARQPEEDLLQALRAGLGARPQVGHRTARANLAGLNDGDAIAQRFRHLERVRRHHDRVAAIRVFAEEILED